MLPGGATDVGWLWEPATSDLVHSPTRPESPAPLSVWARCAETPPAAGASMGPLTQTRTELVDMAARGAAAAEWVLGGSSGGVGGSALRGR